MSTIPVQFTYLTGIRPELFTAARLKGSWDAQGRRTTQWSSEDMDAVRGWDGCPAFTRTVHLDPSNGADFEWGVELTLGDGQVRWGVMRELPIPDSGRRVCTLRLESPAAGGASQQAVYYLNHSRRLGAQKYFRDAVPEKDAAIRFAVWAPNAQTVELCIGNLWKQGDDPATASLIDPVHVENGRRALVSFDRERICGGYIADDVHGRHRSWGPFRMMRANDGLWVTDVNDPEFARFSKFDHIPYMFRITKDNGRPAYRSDIYSRCQIGYGDYIPSGGYFGLTTGLDGTISCSVVVDPDLVTREFTEPLWPELNWLEQEGFFATPAPDPDLKRLRLQDLVIYELHIGALGAAGRAPNKPGTIEDAIGMLDYLQELGINAIELLPLSEFGGGGSGWGYATSHYFAIEYSGGGRDHYKHFIRECHRRGIAVILDVVYNHYNHNAERAEWMFDTDSHEKNAYYWYEGQPGDYPEFNSKVSPGEWGQGGYVDNMSTAWAPRYWDEMVRNMFISSAIALAIEFEVDGFRVDQTTSIRSYNVLHADGRPLAHVNAFGTKFLRELTGSLKLVKPRIMLMAEDHSNWPGVAMEPDYGGLGFDAIWYADFYHHLIGDTDKGDDYAKLIKTAGLGDDRPLAMNYFAGALQATQGGKKIVYHESHDEAGNGKFTHRTIHTAVNGAPLIGATRTVAEARCRFAAGMAMLSAGIPMFLFGEEVGAEKDFLYGRVLENREDLRLLKAGSGQQLFKFYSDLIRLRRGSDALKNENIDVVFVHNEHRLIAFRRWIGPYGELLVVGSLNNRPFNSPSYVINAERIYAGRWREVFNSDAEIYGGDNVGNFGGIIENEQGRFECVIPARGFVVFQKLVGRFGFQPS
jgi:1,4-alpha-glucan branching enzyme